ncbi:MAG: sugar phosphate isomerase/epimerase family protein [Planctomycetota bacterium]|nr:sugar phosphate isomerase/epimerase family protein [Planctomycetota bacterium]
MDHTTSKHSSVTRRGFMAAGAASMAGAAAVGSQARAAEKDAIVFPPEGKRILLSCKLGMITKKDGDKKLSLAQRLSLAGKAGFDGVDLDQAAEYTPQQARDAVAASGVFVHNAINHAHWGDRLTSPDEKVRAKGRANIEHCMRVSQAAGGCGVLIVVGHAKDGSAEEVDRRCQEEIKKLLPLAAALGQPILIENVWNQMHYKHNAPPEQTAEGFIKFVDSFNSPWVGMYYDIGNHWKYGRPGDWIRAFGRRCVKLDVKGFSRAKNKFTDIGEGDLPWAEVRKALGDIGFTGWATAEVGGGGLERLSKVCGQMKKALGA